MSARQLQKLFIPFTIIQMKQKIQNKKTEEIVYKPLTLDEIHEATKKRVSLITKEFTEGFEFIKDYGKSVTFFGSTNLPEGNKYYEQARSLAGKIVKTLGYAVFTGGGPGIMEAANRGAFEAGGPSLGLTIQLPHEQAINKYLTDHINFDYFFSRKVAMSFCAEAYIFLPGGFGTLDELSEILTLVQTNKIEHVPVILLGKDYWDTFDIFLRKEILSRGMITEKDISLYTITGDEDEILEIIRKIPIRNGIKYHYK